MYVYIYIYVREMNDSERYDKRLSKFLIEKEELFGCMPIDH